MATLSRIYDFVRQKFQTKHPNEEFENIRAFTNAFVVHNPLFSDLDFGGMRAFNFGTRKMWTIVDASKFTTVQAALDSIEKGIVFVPAGEYVIGAEPIIMDRDDLFLVGYGVHSVLKKDRIYLPRSADSYDSSARGNPAIWIKKAARCGVLNLLVDMNETQGVDIDPFPTAAIQASNCPDVRIEDVAIENFGDRQFQEVPMGKSSADFAAIDVRGSIRARVLRCNLKRVRSSGIWCGGTATEEGEERGQQYISWNRIEDADVGIQIVPGSSLTVNENILTNIAGSGIVFLDDASDAGFRSMAVKVENNIIEGVGRNLTEDIAGIHFKVNFPRIENLSIVGNHIMNVVGRPGHLAYGIWVRPELSSSLASGSHLSNVHISDNTLNGIYDHGIWVELDTDLDDTSKFRCLSVNGNMVINAGRGPTVRRGITIYVVTSVFQLNEGRFRGLSGLSVSGNIVLGKGLDYGVYVMNSVGTSSGIADDTYEYPVGAGGIVDGNISSTTTHSRPIKVVGDMTLTTGIHYASQLEFTNVVPKERRNVSDETVNG